MYEPGFIALRMKRTRSNPAACWHTDDNIRVLPPAILNFCEVVDDLVESYSNKIRKLHFHHALESFQTQAEGGSHDCAFAKWRVPHSFISKLLNKSFGDLERTTIFGYVLAHQDQVGMFVHGLMQPFFDGID